MIRSIIADHDWLTRKAIYFSLVNATDISVVGLATERTQLIDLVLDLEADIVVMDVELPHPNGLQIARQLAGLKRPPGVVLLWKTYNPILVVQALRYDVLGHVLKRSIGSELSQAIRSVYRSELYVSPVIMKSFSEVQNATASCPA